jgi:hypothetical protein
VDLDVVACAAPDQRLAQRRLGRDGAGSADARDLDLHPLPVVVLEKGKFQW